MSTRGWGSRVFTHFQLFEWGSNTFRIGKYVPCTLSESPVQQLSALLVVARGFERFEPDLRLYCERVAGAVEELMELYDRSQDRWAQQWRDELLELPMLNRLVA